MSTGSNRNYLPVRAEWLEGRTEQALEPDLPIIDAHHHLWDRPGWRYLAEDFLKDAQSGHNIAGSVFVQCQTRYWTDGPDYLRPVGETEFIRSVAERYQCEKPRIACAIVAHADLRRGAASREVLEAHVTAGRGSLKGIRHIAVWDHDHSLMNPLSAGPPGLLMDRVFREGFAQLQPLGLTFDAWVFHPQIGGLADLASAFPGTKIVLNHLGGILGIGGYQGRREETFSSWKASIQALAKWLNVYVKLGGLGMRINGFGFEKGAKPPSSDDLVRAWKPYIETCIEVFGAERCMFESNFPVDKGSYSYGVCWNAFKKLSLGCSKRERDMLFRGTACRFYSLITRRDANWQSGLNLESRS
jgi:predicted TIM-barrel fold metal-dependent hydrolase